MRHPTYEAGRDNGVEITPEDFQKASDRLAENVIGSFVDGGSVPDIDTIIEADVSAAVNDLGLPMEGWAGTAGAWAPQALLGLGLGTDGGFYEDLHDDFNEKGIDTESFYEMMK